MSAIKTENLTKYYGTSRGIIDVSLTVNEGAFFGFIGPNGAGKSTFIRTLLGMISQNSGNAEIFSRDTRTHRLENLADIGYLPSEANFYRGATVKELLTFSAKLRKKDCFTETKRLCERLDLDMSRRIDLLSLGNRKKVGIIAALQHSPQLYILDEPTSGLDPLMQKEFYSILKERNREGATVFLSSHNLSEIARYCQETAVIREGRILVQSRVAELAHTGVKRVILQGASALPTIENARDIHYEHDAISFLYSGDIKYLLSCLNTLSFNDLTVKDPELDEIFLHYYENGGDRI